MVIDIKKVNNVMLNHYGIIQMNLIYLNQFLIMLPLQIPVHNFNLDETMNKTMI